MKLLYSTLTDAYARDGFDGEDQIIDRCTEANLYCVYGLCFYRGLYVMAKRDGEEADAGTRLRILNRKFAEVTSIDVPLCRGAHQIMRLGNFILTTASITNEIFVTNMLTKNSTAVTCDFGVPGGKEGDINHINSLWLHEEEIWAYCHNHGDSFIVSFRVDDFLFDHRTTTTRLIPCVGKKGHNVVIFNDAIYSLSSGTGKLIKHDLRTRRFLRDLSLDGRYLRGLVIHKGDLIAGGSHRADVRADRVQPKSIAIFRIDPNRMTIKDRVTIENRTNILDILIDERESE